MDVSFFVNICAVLSTCTEQNVSLKKRWQTDQTPEQSTIDTFYIFSKFCIMVRMVGGIVPDANNIVFLEWYGTSSECFVYYYFLAQRTDTTQNVSFRNYDI